MLTRNQHNQVTLPACCISYANPEKSSKTDLFSDFLYASFRNLLNYMNKKKKPHTEKLLLTNVPQAKHLPEILGRAEENYLQNRRIRKFALNDRKSWPI